MAEATTYKDSEVLDLRPCYLDAARAHGESAPSTRAERSPPEIGAASMLRPYETRVPREWRIVAKH